MRNKFQKVIVLIMLLILTSCRSLSHPALQTPSSEITFSATLANEVTNLPATPITKTPRNVMTPLPIAITQTPSPLPQPIYQNAFAVAFSVDGRLLSFNSTIANLVPDDQNLLEDTFLYQPETGKIQRILPEGENVNRERYAIKAVSLSANGRYLLYTTRSDGHWQVDDLLHSLYLRDVNSGRVEQIDLSFLEKLLPGSIIGINLSPNGQYLALEVASSGFWIFILERATGKLTSIHEILDVNEKTHNMFNPVFSPDGRYLAFVIEHNELAISDTQCPNEIANCSEIIVYDFATGKIDRIPTHIQFNLGSPYPYLTVSENARWLAWTELEIPSCAFHPLVRLYNRTSGSLKTICTGSEPLCTGHSPSISADGRWLAFGAIALSDANCSPLPDSHAQVYLLDQQSDIITLISADPSGTASNGESGIISLQQEGFSSDIRISGDGRYVAFSSQADNLLPADVQKRHCFDPLIVGSYNCYDLFVYDQIKNELKWVSRPK